MTAVGIEEDPALAGPAGRPDRPAPDTVPMRGLPSDETTLLPQLPDTQALRMPPSDEELTEILQRRGGPEIGALLRAFGPLLLAALRLAWDIFEEVHRAQHPPQP